eukprot:TRINITY_DN70009_c0_g1_i1.p1 TRINITY_DN70009_c0_g1~~TRINITY_DN70009_c0_g1_i1.p1  ORF type:complete len:266 (-),score=33.09 TRINITY_DN70009_c0_g1_i1:94-840(-)
MADSEPHAVPHPPAVVEASREDVSGNFIAIDGAEGRRLASKMGPSSQAALTRWEYAWEPQEHGAYCSLASVLGALRFLGLAGDWTQRRIHEEVVKPYGLMTQGVRFVHGVEMARLLGGDRLLVEERCIRDTTDMACQLRRDLIEAFPPLEPPGITAGVESGAVGDERVVAAAVCIVVNYWRPTGGHWSPLGAFADEHVLVLDTNHKRLPPHWLPLRDMIDALCKHNPVTNSPRGYMVLKPKLRNTHRC